MVEGHLYFNFTSDNEELCGFGQFSKIPRPQFHHLKQEEVRPIYIYYLYLYIDIDIYVFF